MQWVETTARSVDEAKELALNELGVDVADAEFEILEEPRQGLFGRIRGEARVRARVRPTAPRSKTDRRPPRKKQKRSDDGGGTNVQSADTGATDGPTPAEVPDPGSVEVGGAEGTAAGAVVEGAAAESASARPPRERGGRSRGGDRDGGRPRERAPRPVGEGPSTEQVGAEAVRFLTGLLGAFELEGTVAVAQQDDDLEVTVEGDDLGVLIGPRGSTLIALQDVVRVASQRRLGDHDSHLRIDVSGYRQRRREALSRFTEQLIADVIATGTPSVLEPMPSADRKVVHDTVAAASGVVSRSDGDDPYRRVVISPAPADD